MVIKMVALGIFGKKCYLGDTWNRLDFFIVLAGWVFLDHDFLIAPLTLWRLLFSVWLWSWMHYYCTSYFFIYSFTMVFFLHPFSHTELVFFFRLVFAGKELICTNHVPCWEMHWIMCWDENYTSIWSMWKDIPGRNQPKSVHKKQAAMTGCWHVLLNHTGNTGFCHVHQISSSILINSTTDGYLLSTQLCVNSDRLYYNFFLRFH